MRDGEVLTDFFKPLGQKLPADELLATEWDGDDFTVLCEGIGGSGIESSKTPPSSHIASTRAKLYIEEALSNDEPSCVTVCEAWDVCADPIPMEMSNF